MIKQKNIGEFMRNSNMPGNTSTGKKTVILIPYACQLKSLYAISGTAGATGTQVVDITKNGTSIFSGAGKVNQATAVTANTYGPLTTNPTTFAKGDVVVVNCTATNTTPAVDWVLEMCFQRLRGTGSVGAMQTDSAVGAEAE